MPTTNCAGFKIQWTRALDCKEYADMIRKIEEHLNTTLDTEERRYRLDLLRKWEGGFIITAFPDGPEGATKTFRHVFRQGSPVGRLINPYPWPEIPNKDTLNYWYENGQDFPLIPEGSGSPSHLRAQPRNVSVWTVEELACVAHVLTTFGAECFGTFPTREDLTMDYGPVKLLPT
jgi:hypothetical protein